MARQAPEIAVAAPVSGQANVVAGGASNRPLGIYGSYYKLFRCHDGKLRLNLISEEEYLESKKARPISVDDVSSTTDILPVVPLNGTAAATARPCPHHQRASTTPTLRIPRIPSSATQKRFLPRVLPESAEAQPCQQRMTLKRQRTTAKEGAHQSNSSSSNNNKRQKKENSSRSVRSTVAVADLIAEYIPPTAAVVGVANGSSPGSLQMMEAPDSSCDRASPALLSASSSSSAVVEPGTPAFWNSWIETVGQRFPMADMSIRKVLDTLDRRPELAAATTPDE
ncbi:hypothetical protein BV898_10622 [Hypsibius exemplaris]|uniref:Uncharacterized protein n=1 Tax=Hypsibius exemplaris TaxID=2072580 RepID=A0A1W0WJ41_HYPEX|nr:hypothetical protein BV898_10622 [Hypsibius exemplaris]